MYSSFNKCFDNFFSIFPPHSEFHFTFWPRIYGYLLNRYSLHPPFFPVLMTAFDKIFPSTQHGFKKSNKCARPRDGNKQYTRYWGRTFWLWVCFPLSVSWWLVEIKSQNTSQRLEIKSDSYVWVDNKFKFLIKVPYSTNFRSLFFILLSFSLTWLIFQKKKNNPQ